MMNSHHLAPVEGEPILGTCIDADNTKAHEDMFRITKDKGGTLQLDIAVVIPPLKIVPLDKLQASLNDLLVNESRQPRFFLNLETRTRYGFNSTFPRRALVVTYVIDSYGEILLEEVLISQAVGKMMRPYTEYNNSHDSSEILSDLRRVLKTKPGIVSYVEEILANNRPNSDSPGYQTTFITTQLFNSTCRMSARSIGVNTPFIRRPHRILGDHDFLLNDGLAKFNSPLRDPCALINTSNLVSYCEGEETRPFTEEFLRERIPLITTYKK